MALCYTRSARTLTWRFIPSLLSSVDEKSFRLESSLRLQLSPARRYHDSSEKYLRSFTRKYVNLKNSENSVRHCSSVKGVLNLPLGIQTTLDTFPLVSSKIRGTKSSDTLFTNHSMRCLACQRLYSTSSASSPKYKPTSANNGNKPTLWQRLVSTSTFLFYTGFVVVGLGITVCIISTVYVTRYETVTNVIHLSRDWLCITS